MANPYKDSMRGGFKFNIDPNFPDGIYFDTYAKQKINYYNKELARCQLNEKIFLLERYLKNEKNYLDNTKNTVTERKEKKEPFNNNEYTKLESQMQKVINWLENEQENIQDLMNNSDEETNTKVKKGDLGSTQNLTIAFMYILQKLNTSESSFDTSKLKNFINLFINKSPGNIKKSIVNSKRILFKHLYKGKAKNINRNDKKAFIDVLIKVRTIFEELSLSELINEVSQDIERLTNEIER